MCYFIVLFELTTDIFHVQNFECSFSSLLFFFLFNIFFVALVSLANIEHLHIFPSSTKFSFVMIFWFLHSHSTHFSSNIYFEQYFVRHREKKFVFLFLITYNPCIPKLILVLNNNNNKNNFLFSLCCKFLLSHWNGLFIQI